MWICGWAALGRQLQPDDLENVTRMVAEEGRRLSARDYVNTLLMIHRSGRRLAGFFDGYDIILSPTLADPPLPLGALDMMGEDLKAYIERMWGHLAFTPLFNLSGCPAASLPMHMTPDGLPVGVQIGASFGNEVLLCRLLLTRAREMPCGVRRFGVHSGVWIRRPGGGRFG